MKTKNNVSKYLSLALGISMVATACTRDNDPIPEIPPSEGTEMTIDGGSEGSSAKNTVFVDLSGESQIAVERQSWHIGFYQGSLFRVILNNTAGHAITAKSTGQTDINAVNESNVDVNELAFGLDMTTFQVVGTYDLVDDTTGNITNTAIAEISTGDNEVYIIHVAQGLVIESTNVWKIKISRSGNGYSLQYAKLQDTNVQTVEIQKDSDYDFQYFSFTDGKINSAPKKSEWDFSWGNVYHFTMFGGIPAPYNFPDFIQLNSYNGVTAAEVLIADTPYEEFDQSHIASLSFSDSKNTIGSSWRVAPAPQVTNPGTRKDRYYVIKDTSGNVYKLRFNSFSSEDGGKRGYPEFEYQLVTRG